MKKLVIKFAALLKNRWVIGGVLCCVLLAVGAFAYSRHSLEKFKLLYSRYDLAAATQQNAAFIPGATENPIRSELNTTLARVLTKETKTSERLDLAKHGLALVGEMNKQVDDMDTTGAPVKVAINNLQGTLHDPGNILRLNSIGHLVGLAEKQQATIQTVRGLSYKANFQIQQIFSRVISDKGTLVSSYVSELNDEIPLVEAQFDDRQNAYADLQKNMSDVQRAYTAVSEATL
jgi:hypothetical protein